MIFSHFKQKLPKVNKLLAEKLRDEEQGIVSTNKKKKKVNYFNRLVVNFNIFNVDKFDIFNVDK